MDNIELAEQITSDVMVVLNGNNVFFNWRNYQVDSVRNLIKEVTLDNLNAHYQTESVPAVSSLPTTCNEPGIAY